MSEEPKRVGILDRLNSTGSEINGSWRKALCMVEIRAEEKKAVTVLFTKETRENSSGPPSVYGEASRLKIGKTKDSIPEDMKLEFMSLWKFLKYVIEIIDNSGNISVRRTPVERRAWEVVVLLQVDRVVKNRLNDFTCLIELMCGDSSEQSYPGPSPWSLSVGLCL